MGDETDGLTLDRDGAQRFSGAVGGENLDALLAATDGMLGAAAGRRLFGDALVSRLCDPQGAIGDLARRARQGARPVRAVLFDKTPANNWAVAWHQDRTIAVRRRLEVEEFGPWSSKSGLVHVEPPFAILAGMLTLRLHLDDCGSNNAPLLIAPGSHRLGKVAATDATMRATALGVARCLAEAGDVWLYATPILHASERAAMPTRRRVLQVDFAASDLPHGLEWAGI